MLGNHTYAMAGNFPIKVTINDKGGSSLIAKAMANVASAPTLTMYGVYTTSGDVAGSPPPGSPGLWVLGEFATPLGQLPSAYTFEVNWGDGRPDTAATFYNPLNPLEPGEAMDILDNHIYATGGPPGGNPKDYTITIAITGPGIDPANPVVGTIIEPVSSP